MSVAAIAAVSCVALVVLAAPLNVTTAPAANPDPFTVNVNAAPPAAAPLSEIDVMAIFELLIVNWRLAEVPPPGAALVTATVAVPAVAMSAAVIARRELCCANKCRRLGGAIELNHRPCYETGPVYCQSKCGPARCGACGRN